MFILMTEKEFREMSEKKQNKLLGLKQARYWRKVWNYKEPEKIKKNIKKEL
jgi:hypothetical protein